MSTLTAIRVTVDIPTHITSYMQLPTKGTWIPVTLGTSLGMQVGYADHFALPTTDWINFFVYIVVTGDTLNRVKQESSHFKVWLSLSSKKLSAYPVIVWNGELLVITQIALVTPQMAVDMESKIQLLLPDETREDIHNDIVLTPWRFRNAYTSDNKGLTVSDRNEATCEPKRPGPKHGEDRV